MADITDPLILKWVREDVRPLSEELAALLLKCTEFADRYDDTIAPLVGDLNVVSTDNVEDGREAEGVSRLTVADLTNFINVTKSIRTLADGTTRQQVALPNVRKIRISVGSGSGVL